MPKKTTITALKERADMARQLIETAQLEAVAKSVRLASQALGESWIDDPANYVDPREWQADDYGRPLSIGGYGSLGATRSDREDGTYRPFFDNESELASIRAMARGLCTANGLGLSVLEKLTDYVIGDGFKFKFSSVDPAQEKLAGALQEIVDRFIEDNNWQGDADREVFARARRDGEAFPVVYPGQAGGSVLRIIEPEQVCEPQNTGMLDEYYAPGQATNWTYGVHTLDSDVQRVLGYYVQWSDKAADFDYLPVTMVEHVKLNVDRTIKRGLSDFYPVLKRLERADKLLRNTEEGAAIQAAIAYIVETAAGVTKSASESAQIARADYTQNSVPGSQSTRATYTKVVKPGTVLTVGNGQQYKPGPMGSERSPNFLLVLQAAMRWVGNRWSMPEFLVSGDASNANYASTMVAESPWVKSCQAKQTTMKRKFANIMWMVVQNAINAGLLEPLGVWRMDRNAVLAIKKLVTLDIEAPQLEVRDLQKETDRRKTLYEKKVISLKTWTSQEGEDFETEQEQIKKEPKPVDPLLGMVLGPDGKPSVDGDPAEDPNVQRQQQRQDAKDKQEAAAAKTIESRIQEARKLLFEAWP